MGPQEQHRLNIHHSISYCTYQYTLHKPFKRTPWVLNQLTKRHRFETLFAYLHAKIEKYLFSIQKMKLIHF